MFLNHSAPTAKRAAPATTPTSVTKISKRLGFTLLELMIAITIVAFVVAIVLPRINNRNNEVKSTVRKFITLSRELRFKAKLQNATYRLVFDLEEKHGKPYDTYWVEKGPGNILNDYNPKSPPKNPAQIAAEEKDAKEHDEKIPPPQFLPDTSITRKPVVLPDGLQIKSVELDNLDDPVTKGVVYIHFLPSGFADAAAIHLKIGDKIEWTLVTEPFTGQMAIIPSDKHLKDLRAQQ